jgi:hypothetical protein
VGSAEIGKQRDGRNVIFEIGLLIIAARAGSEDERPTARERAFRHKIPTDDMLIGERIVGRIFAPTVDANDVAELRRFVIGQRPERFGGERHINDAGAQERGKK